MLRDNYIYWKQIVIVCHVKKLSPFILHQTLLYYWSFEVILMTPDGGNGWNLTQWLTLNYMTHRVSHYYYVRNFMYVLNFNSSIYLEAVSMCIYANILDHHHVWRSLGPTLRIWSNFEKKRWIFKTPFFSSF